jgi:hypothetical protein
MIKIKRAQITSNQKTLNHLRISSLLCAIQKHFTAAMQRLADFGSRFRAAGRKAL